MANPRLSKAAAIAILVLTYGTAAMAADVLTLEQAIEIAIGQNPNLQSSALEIQKAEDKLKATATHRLPSFNLNVLGSQQLQPYEFTIEKGVLGDYASTGPLPANDVHLKSPTQPSGLMTAKVSQPLTSLIRIRRNLDSLKTGVEIANEQTRADRQKTVREVKQVYYSLQQVESSLRSVLQTEELYRELERLTENYVAGAVVLKSELLEIQTRVAKTQQTALQLRDQMATGKEQLNRLMGRDVLVDFEIQPVLEIANDEFDLDAARVRALAQRPEIRQAQLRQKQAEQDLRAKKAEYIPDIAAEFNSMTLMNYGNFLPLQNTSVGVSMSWEIFDWGRKRHEIAEKRRTIIQAGNTEKDTISSVLVDVNDKFRQLRYSRGQLRVARLAQETAVESLRVAKNKYAVQAVLLKDVLQGQVSLEQSNSDYQQALLSFWNARADFERALGEDQ